MTLEDAIEQNEQWLKEHRHLGAVNEFKALPLYEAIKLGLEALKRERDQRDHRIPGWNTPLPGETAE